MSRAFFAGELDNAASWWRIYRRDGVTLGFTTHDRDLYFGGILHRAAPGMLPSAIRQSILLDDDEAEVDGALAHDTIRGEDIAAGQFDGARIVCGVADWESLEHAVLYTGAIDTLLRESGTFSARLRSAKADLDVDPVPRTSPSCRARFCGPGCNLSASRFTSRAVLAALDPIGNRARFDLAAPSLYVEGELRFIDGPQAGIAFAILALDESGFTLDRPLDAGVMPGMRALLRQGCDRTIAACAERFGNAINFQGEPHLPGSDLLAQYPQPR
ncbi:DUF2163 domain-containing protein [Qipengyuania flava]|nr:DUF2163 domain-containing protein [Qipengyuania flava]